MTHTDTTTELAKIEDVGARVVRTIVQTGIPAFVGFSVVLPQILGAIGLPATSKVEIDLLIFSGGVTAVAGALTRVMAVPGVNAFLAKIGIGAKTTTVAAPVSAPVDLPLTAVDASTETPAPADALAPAPTDPPTPAA
jgi:hypothetical protein